MIVDVFSVFGMLIVMLLVAFIVAVVFVRLVEMKSVFGKLLAAIIVLSILMLVSYAEVLEKRDDDLNMTIEQTQVCEVEQ
jgi:membrane protein implicated in regulation of membrane protease activity